MNLGPGGTAVREHHHAAGGGRTTRGTGAAEGSRAAGSQRGARAEGAADGSDRPVVAAVAGMGWAPQPRAVAWAAAEAASRRVPLRLVHGFATLPYEAGPAEHDLLRTAARAELADAALLARRGQPGLRVSGRLLQQRPDLALQEESQRASLVIIGTGTHAVDETETRYGSLVGTLLTAAACPVVAVPADQHGHRGHREATRHPGPEAHGEGGEPAPIVVATDGTPVSRPALTFAFELAARRDARLTVVRCWPGGPPAGQGPGPARMSLVEILAGIGELFPGVAVTDGSCEGNPDVELATWSHRASLLVIGSHGRDRWATAVWGSVSRTLVREAACPVVVVRPLPQ